MGSFGAETSREIAFKKEEKREERIGEERKEDDRRGENREERIGGEERPKGERRGITSRPFVPVAFVLSSANYKCAKNFGDRPKVPTDEWDAGRSKTGRGHRTPYYMVTVAVK